MEQTKIDYPNIECMSERILIKVDAPEEVLESGIILTGNAVDKPISGIVYAIGPHNTPREHNIKLGDRVFYNQHAGIKMSYKKVEYLMLGLKDIFFKEV